MVDPTTLHGKLISKPPSVTCHMKSHRVSCHLTGGERARSSVVSTTV